MRCCRDRPHWPALDTARTTGSCSASPSESSGCSAPSSTSCGRRARSQRGPHSGTRSRSDTRRVCSFKSRNRSAARRTRQFPVGRRAVARSARPVPASCIGTAWARRPQPRRIPIHGAGSQPATPR
jgi:hypothetical protein